MTNNKNPIEIIIEHSSSFSVTSMIEDALNTLVLSKDEDLNIVCVYDLDADIDGHFSIDTVVDEHVMRYNVMVPGSMHNVKNPSEIIKSIKRAMPEEHRGVMDNVDVLVIEKDLDNTTLQRLSIKCKMEGISIIASKQKTPW